MQKKKFDILNRIAELRLKRCQTLMIIGWETDKYTKNN